MANIAENKARRHTGTKARSGAGRARKGPSPKGKVQRPHRRAARESKSKVHRSKGQNRGRGLNLKAQQSLVLNAVDEIDMVTDILQAAPMFHHLALMVRQIDEGMPAQERDEIARAAKKHFDFDIDKLIEQPHDLHIVNEIPEMLATTARWRLERLGRVLYRGLRGKE